MSGTDSLSWAGASEKGPVRNENQDAWEIRPEAGVAVVADGVGGGPGGARASRIAARMVADSLASDPWPDTSGEGRRRAIRKAHEAVATVWREEPAMAGMATTLTAVRWVGGRVEGVHVGDSRAYRLDAHAMEPLTRDHTPAGAYLAHRGGDRGILRTHPRRHLLLQAVGGADAAPDPDLFQLESVGDGVVLVLCSDGVEAALPEERFRQLLGPALQGDLEGALGAVMKAALKAGAPDNTTLILLSRGNRGSPGDRDSAGAGTSGP